MPFFNRQRLSDETIEQILATSEAPDAPESTLAAFAGSVRDAGKEPPAEAVVTEHLSAMMAETRHLGEDAIEATARPEPPRRLRVVPKSVAARAVASTAVVALAVAGVLPGPVQAAASDVLAVVGISIPDGADDRPEARSGDDQRQEREPTPTAGDDPRQPAGEDHGQPLQDDGGAATRRADRDNSSSGPSRSGSDSTDADRRDEARDPESRSGPSVDTDGDGSASPDNSGSGDSGSGQASPDNSGSSDSGSGPASPDNSGSGNSGSDGEDGSESRSGPSGGSIPDPGDALDAPEE